jgi:SAM-dependent methyltransferase
MSSDQPRPFYGEFAWAYALLVEAPVAERCDFIAERFAQAGVAPGARVLDAGCGPGDYAIELARRGYVVTGIDASADFVAEARRRPEASTLPASFLKGDILALPASLRVDAILCRGVLNDLLEDAQRPRVFVAFASVLREGGALLFDVRDWQATAARKRREPVTEKIVTTARGALTFRSATQLDEPRRRLVIRERHTLAGPDGTRDVEHAFAMRCWTRDEIVGALRLAGLAPLHFYGDYDANVPLGGTDRIVCLARRG